MDAEPAASSSSYWVVVPAAGFGQRMGADLPKQYLPLAGKPVLRWTLDALLLHPRVAGVMLSVAADDARWRECVPHHGAARVRSVTGGAQRAESVEAGLTALEGTVRDDDWVLVHDAVRPCLHASDLERLVVGLEGDAVGGLLAAPSADTMKQIDMEQRVAATLDRRQVWRALTPQMFRFGTLRKAYAHAREADRVPTDESTAVEALGLKPKLIVGRADNVKITQPEDLGFAEAVLRARGAL
jgi:2-C-methyl-D-erythritol 4-phosphate cytidylyltransferase